MVWGSLRYAGLGNPGGADMLDTCSPELESSGIPSTWSVSLGAALYSSLQAFCAEVLPATISA